MNCVCFCLRGACWGIIILLFGLVRGSSRRLTFVQSACQSVGPSAFPSSKNYNCTNFAVFMMHTKGAGSILHNNGNFKPQLNYKFLKNFLGTIMKPMKHIVEHPRYRSLTILAANSQVLIRLRNIRFSVLLFFSLWRLFCTQLQLRFNLAERSTIRFH